MSLATITRPLENDLSLPHLLSPPRVSGQSSSHPTSRRPAKHPAALWVLCAAEASERFGFFLMLTLFTLFLNERRGFSEARASAWYGAYLAAIYATPFFGGWLAGRFRSRRFWVMCGAGALAVGYFALALQDGWTLIFGLCILAIGNGLFKPNISVLVGNLYAIGDARRDEAFGIFYLAVNAGGIFGALVGELLRRTLGWPATFCAAGFALIASLLVLRLGSRHLRMDYRAASAATGSRPARHGVRALLLLCVVLIPFWMAYYQQGSSLTFWARDGVTRTIYILGMRREIPPGWFSASSAMFVILLSTPLAALARRRRWNSADKITAGVIFGAASFALLWFAVRQSEGTRVHPIWLLAHYLLMTVGELLLAPIGLSVVSKLAPPRWVGVLFGLWFASSAIGNWLAGAIGRLWVAWPHEQFFALLALVLLLTATIMTTQLRWLRRTIP